MLSPADYIAQLESVVREQMATMDQLRATIGQKDAELDGVIDWIRGDAGALEALQAIYVDPRQSPANVIKSASAAINFERSRPPSAALIGSFKLSDYFQARREPRVIEHDESESIDPPH